MEANSVSAIELAMIFCSGIKEGDHYNILTVSPGTRNLQQGTVESSQPKLNVRQPYKRDCPELMLVLEGEVLQKIEEREYLYPAGSCCLFRPGMTHLERFTARSKAVFIGLSDELLGKLEQVDGAAGNDILQYTFKTTTDDAAGTKEYAEFFPACENDKNNKRLRELSDLLMYTLLSPKLGSEYMVLGIICEMFDILDSRESYYTTFVDSEMNTDALIFARICHILEATNGHVSRSKLEKILGFSGNYLNTIVQKHAGMCLFDYGMTFCLDKAAELLTTTKSSITAIAKELQFTNQSHFYKLFREKYGMTPKEYRKEYAAGT